jgi:hypothetical protein
MERELGAPYIGRRGKGKGRGEAVAQGRWAAGAINGDGARAGVSGDEGARMRRRCIESGRWWERKRRERLGGGEGAGERWVRVGRGQGRRGGGLGRRRWKTHLTGGSHLSARGRERRGRGGSRELLGRQGMGRRWEERREESGPDGDGFAFQILFKTNF